MNRKERRKQAKLKRVERVKIKDIKKGPIRHLTLPPMLVTRIRKLHQLFGKYFGDDGVEHWIEDFQRDVHPEKEVIIWEGMARAYEEYTAAVSLSPAAKRELYHRLLSQTMGYTEEEQDLQHLSEEDARAIRSIHQRVGSEIKKETDFYRRWGGSSSG